MTKTKKKKKNLIYKNKGLEPIHQKYKANESTSITPKNNQQKKGKNPMRIGPMAMKWQLTLAKKT